MPTFAELSAKYGPEEANRLIRAERVHLRAANAQIRARMLALGIAEDAAIIAANLMQEFPSDPTHGLGALADEPLTQAKVRTAIAAYAATQALGAAA